jgi:hypothetical protein
MRKMTYLVLVGVLALAVGFLSNSSVAQAQQFLGYTSGIQVQNLNTTSQANVSLTFYKEDGTVDTTISDTIAANGSKTYFGATLAVSQGFKGSAVISSNQPVGAISNMLNSSFTAGAAYVGTGQGSTSVQLPLLQRGNSGFNSWISVQNAGNAAATVQINYSTGTTANASIPVGSAKTFIQALEQHGDAKVFSGVITSNQPVVAVVVQEDPKTIFAYTGFTAGSTNPVMPLINANNAGYVTGAQIQNVGNQATEVTVSYTPSLVGTACTETQTIPANSSRTFSLFAFASGANSTCAPGSRFVGAARVTSNSASQPLAAVVNQLLIGTNGEAYGSFDAATATNKVVMPLIMDRNSGYFTGFNIMNVGDVATNVNCTFSNTNYTYSATNLQPGAATTDLQQDKIAAGYVGSGTCTATASGARIVGVVNELQAGATTDQFLVYEGINISN